MVIVQFVAGVGRSLLSEAERGGVFSFCWDGWPWFLGWERVAWRDGFVEKRIYGWLREGSDVFTGANMGVKSRCR